MKITQRHAPKEVPFGDIPVTGGFLFQGEPHVKIKLPDGTPAGVDLTDGGSAVFKATTFVIPVEMEVIYS